MERSRKKSSLQQLEDKQMKRYHRSKKRSQKREQIDDEPELEKDTKSNHKIKTIHPVPNAVKCVDNKESNQINDKRKSKKRVITDDSYEKAEQNKKEIKISNTKEMKSKNTISLQKNELPSKPLENNSYESIIEKIAPITYDKTVQSMKIIENVSTGRFKEGLEVGKNVNIKNSTADYNLGYATRSVLKEKERSHKKDEITEIKDEVGSKVKDLLLDSTNTQIDKHEYDDSEKQYYQQLESIFGIYLNRKTSVKQPAVLMEDKEFNVYVDQNVAVKDSIKSNPKVAYEIIEEIVETTEITYTLVCRDTEDTNVEEEMKKYESQSSEFTEYLTDLGKYVNSLERRVNTLEEGEKKLGSDRSPSLTSNESDEGVDLTGKAAEYSFNCQMNAHRIIQNKEKDLSILPRKVY